MTPAPREGRARSLEHCIQVAVNNGWLLASDLARAELTALLSEADAARAKAIEECAKLCDDESRKAWREGMTEPKDQFSWKPSLSRRYAETAEAIRALAAQDRAKETG